MYILYIHTILTLPIFTTIHIILKQRKNCFINKADSFTNNLKSLI